MTEDEFKDYLKGFFAWTSKRDRPVTHWLLSLDEWATTEYNENYKRKLKNQEGVKDALLDS